MPRRMLTPIRKTRTTNAPPRARRPPGLTSMTKPPETSTGWLVPCTDEQLVDRCGAISTEGAWGQTQSWTARRSCHSRWRRARAEPHNSKSGKGSEARHRIPQGHSPQAQGRRQETRHRPRIGHFRCASGLALQRVRLRMVVVRDRDPIRRPRTQRVLDEDGGGVRCRVDGIYLRLIGLLGTTPSAFRNIT